MSHIAAAIADLESARAAHMDKVTQINQALDVLRTLQPPEAETESVSQSVQTPCHQGPRRVKATPPRRATHAPTGKSGAPRDTDRDARLVHLVTRSRDGLKLTGIALAYDAAADQAALSERLRHPLNRLVDEGRLVKDGRVWRAADAAKEAL